jgi:hypothetical protein
MSYEKVKSISIKNRSITSACNNVRPLYYETWNPKSESEEEFIKMVLINTLDGNFHLQINKSTLKFLWAVWQFRLNDENNELHNKRWNNYDYANKKEKYTQYEIAAATEETKNRLYNLYQTTVFDIKTYKIRFDSNSFVRKITRAGLHWCMYKDDAKSFTTYQEAFIYVKEKGYNWENRLQIELA